MRRVSELLKAPLAVLESRLMFFQLGKLSAGAAAELAGVPKVIFLDLCGQYDIPISQITAEELRAEVG